MLMLTAITKSTADELRDHAAGCDPECRYWTCRLCRRFVDEVIWGRYRD